MTLFFVMLVILIYLFLRSTSDYSHFMKSTIVLQHVSIDKRTA